MGSFTLELSTEIRLIASPEREVGYVFLVLWWFRDAAFTFDNSRNGR
jgi:hypothetical protein